MTNFRSKERPSAATDLFLFGWTSLCALAMVFQTKALAGLPLAMGDLEYFILFSTIFTYNCTAQRRWRQIPGLLAALPAFYFWLQFDWVLKGISVAPALLWVVYLGWPGALGLRSLPWLKPAAIALAWALVTVALPLPLASWLHFAPVFLVRTAFVFALALAYDLLDRNVDQRQGLDTLAGRLGVQATLRVFYIFLGLSAANALLAWQLQCYTRLELAALVFSLGLSAWIVPWQLERFGPQQWQKMVIDSMMLLQALLIIWI